MTKANALANALAELSAADDALKVAEAALGLGIKRDAMSRTYYAAFHAARALLLLEGLEPKTHAGVLRMLSEHLIRSGKLEARFGMALTRVQAYRQAADYSYSFDGSSEDVAHEIAEARELIARARAAVSTPARD